MTVLEHEAIGLIDRMAAIWPARAWTPEHAREWRVYFVGDIPADGLRFDVANITLEQLKRSSKHRPTIAEFAAEARVVWSKIPQPPDLELEVQDPDADAPVVPVDEARQRIREIGEQLKPRNPR